MNAGSHRPAPASPHRCPVPGARGRASQSRRTLRAALLSASLAPLLGAQPAHPVDATAELPHLDVAADSLPADSFTLRPTTISRTAATLADTLQSAPGVIVQDSFGGFEPPRLSLRGSGLQSAPSSRGVQFLLENFPLTLADGSFNSALIDPQLFDRIEVFRGAAAAPLSPTTLGGAINLRPAPAPPPAGMELQAEAASFGGARLRLAGGLNRDSAAGRLGVSLARLDGFRDHSAQDRQAFFGLVRRPSPVGCDTSLSLYHARARYDVPGPLTRAAAGAAPRSISDEVRRDQPRREAELTQVTLQTSQQSSVLQLDAGLSWLHHDDWFRQLRVSGIGNSHSDDVTFRGVIARRFEAEAGEHLVRLGTTLSRGWRGQRRFNHDADGPGLRFADDRLFATTASVDAAATAQFHATLAGTVGLGGLATRRDRSDRLGGDSPGSTRRASRALLPRVQLHWQPQRDLSVFAAVTRAVEPPTFDDLLGVTGTYPDLAVRSRHLADQCATTGELGTTGRWGRAGWDLTAYHAAWTNEILRLADDHGLPRGAVNATPTRHTGIEAAGHCLLLEGSHSLRLTAAATWGRFTFAHDPIYGRLRLAGTPPWTGSVQLAYERPAGLFASTALEWTAGATPADHANRLAFGGHTLAHVRLGWRYRAAGRHVPDRERSWSRWTIFAEVRNVLGRDYLASTSGVLDLARDPANAAIFLPGPGRSFALGFSAEH